MRKENEQLKLKVASLEPQVSSLEEGDNAIKHPLQIEVDKLKQELEQKKEENQKLLDDWYKQGGLI